MTAENLKAWRTSMGWTQLKAATAMGITQISYNAMERGRTEISKRTELSCAALANDLTEWKNGTV